MNCLNAISDGKTNPVKVFPNPAEDVLHIAFPLGTSCQLALYNQLGQQVVSKKIKKATEKAQMDLSGLGTGIYYLTISANGEKHAEKTVRLPSSE